MPFKPTKKIPPTSKRMPGRRWQPGMGNVAPTISIASPVGGGPVGNTTSIAPPAVGGGSNIFSVGNAANGRINLGGILGTRANENFNPADPQGQLPYAHPSFLRRMFGDTGDALNAQYVNEQNAQAREDVNWQRDSDLKWALKKADLDMEAARANATNAAHVQGIKMQMDEDSARRGAERSARELETWGTNDPILIADRSKAQFERNERLGAFRPVGGSAFVRDNPTGDPTLIAREGGTPGGQPMFGPGGEFLGLTQATPGQFVEWNGGGKPQPGGATGAPTGSPKPKINPQALQDFNSSATPNATPTNYLGDFSGRPPQPQVQTGFPTMLGNGAARPPILPSLNQDFGITPPPNSWTPEQRKMMLDADAKKQAISNPVTQTLLQRILGTLPR